MPERVLNWGLLSTAHINAAIIPPLRLSARNRLAAVASRDLSRARAYAAEWRIPRAFGSYDDLLADPEIDVVYISLPNSMHREWAERAAAAGKHVLCEKPLAGTPQDVAAMAAAARRAGVVLVEGFMYLHHPQAAAAKAIVESGRIGQVTHIHGAYGMPLSPEGYIRLDPKLGGGSLWDTGGYPVSYARYLLGAEPVEACGWAKTGATGVDEAFVGNLRFPSDVFLQFDTHFHTPWRPRFEIAGTEALLTFTGHPFKQGPGSFIRLIQVDGEELIATDDLNPYAAQIEDVADAVLLGKAPRVSLEFSEGNAAAMVALLRSAAEGRTVPVEQVNANPHNL